MLNGLKRIFMIIEKLLLLVLTMWRDIAAKLGLKINLGLSPASGVPRPYLRVEKEINVKGTLVRIYINIWLFFVQSSSVYYLVSKPEWEYFYSSVLVASPFFAV